MNTDDPAAAAARVNQDAYNWYAGDSPSTLNMIRTLVGLGMNELQVLQHLRAGRYDDITASRMASAAAHIIAHRELIMQDVSLPGGAT